jgi:hypothetical protein
MQSNMGFLHCPDIDCRFVSATKTKPQRLYVYLLFRQIKAHLLWLTSQAGATPPSWIDKALLIGNLQ